MRCRMPRGREGVRRSRDGGGCRTAPRRYSRTRCADVRSTRAAAAIRRIRPLEPYKGKGIKYADEYVQRKAGKTGTK